ncbi:hypothetical protein L915_19932, partial [Phytophthora nicotianae]
WVLSSGGSRDDSEEDYVEASLEVHYVGGVGEVVFGIQQIAGWLHESEDLTFEKFGKDGSSKTKKPVYLVIILSSSNNIRGAVSFGQPCSKHLNSEVASVLECYTSWHIF